MGGPGPGGLLGRLSDRYGRGGRAAYAAAFGLVVLLVVGAVGIATGQPWVVPSLAPTIMVLSETPLQASASPRNVVIGHVIALVIGYLSLLVTGLTDEPSAIVAGLDGPRVIAVALSLALTAGVLQALEAPHPPAGATTLLVSLGVLTEALQLLVVLVSVLLVTALSVGMNRLAGVRQAGVGAVAPEKS